MLASSGASHNRTNATAAIIEPGLVAEIKRLELRTKRLVSSDLIGRFRSSFKGSGLTFADLREYQPGDEVKSIHWKATARSGTVYVKSYQEERSLQIMLAVDLSTSTVFGTPKSRHKREIEFAALISVLSARCGDALGLALFSDKIDFFLPPARSRTQMSRVVSQLLEQKPTQKATDLSPCLRHLSTHLSRRSVIFVISDFYSSQFEEELKALSCRHDVILVNVSDNFDKLGGFRDCGLVEIEDAESGRRYLIDTSSKKSLSSLLELEQARINKLTELGKRCGADIITITDNLIKPFADLMLRRAKYFGR